MRATRRFIPSSIPCLEGRPEDDTTPARLAGFYGNILPAAWSLMLALRARGLGSAWTTLVLRHEKELAQLQDDFATIDLYTRRTDPAVVEILLKRFRKIVFRMDGNHNHKRPHLHIDYGNERHSASYAIDSGERLAGQLANKYDRKVNK